MFRKIILCSVLKSISASHRETFFMFLKILKMLKAIRSRYSSPRHLTDRLVSVILYLAMTDLDARRKVKFIENFDAMPGTA